MARRVGKNGVVVAIEPHPFTFQTLVRNINLNHVTNVLALNVAAWNGESHLKLFTAQWAGRNSVKTDRKQGWVTVPARRMDEVLTELKLTRVDWVKIDGEGAEYEALEGFSDTIQKYKPRIVLEVERPHFARVKRFLELQRYNMLNIASSYYLGTPIPEDDS